MNAEVRTYGGWRERRGFGLAGMSGTQTGVALAGVVVCLATALVWPEALMVMAVPLLAMVALVAVRVRGEPVAAVVQRHGRFRWARQRGGLSFRSSESGLLPGVLADAQVIEATDAAGRTVGVFWSPGRRTLTALVPLEPVGPELVDTDEVEGWVSAWSDWLAHLGYSPLLENVAVVVRTSPAGEVARTVLSVTVGQAVQSALDQATVALFDALSGAHSLGACGTSVLEPFTPEELMTWVRHGFDPAAAGRAAVAADMRPTAIDEAWDTYRHDGWFSAVYAWHEPPGETVTPAGLARFLGPAEYRKAVAMVLTPVPAHEAAREVESQAQAALFRREYRRRLGRDETARQAVDLRRARHTAEEQATGAGIVDVSLFAVVSAQDPATLAPAAADFENRAGEARLRLRRCYGEQARAFACTLGVGFLPSRWW